MDLDARYRAYVGWCAKLGVPSADFETWFKVQRNLPESAN